MDRLTLKIEFTHKDSSEMRERSMNVLCDALKNHPSIKDTSGEYVLRVDLASSSIPLEPPKYKAVHVRKATNFTIDLG